MFDLAVDVALIDFKNESHKPWRLFQLKMFCLNDIFLLEKIEIMIFQKIKLK